MIKGNKGEWSELYVLLRLLAYGKDLCGRRSGQKRLKMYTFRFLKIIREEVKRKKT